MERTPTFLELIPLLIFFGLMAFSFGRLFIESLKLDDYRRSVNPGDVINYLYQNDLAFKVVVSRPGKDFVILADMDDETRTFTAKINKIYPL